MTTNRRKGRWVRTTARGCLQVSSHCCIQVECNNKGSNKVSVLHIVYRCLNYLDSPWSKLARTECFSQGSWRLLSHREWLFWLYCPEEGFSLSSDVFCNINTLKGNLFLTVFYADLQILAYRDLSEKPLPVSSSVCNDPVLKIVSSKSNLFFFFLMKHSTS